MNTHDDTRLALGAYAIGTLEPAEAQLVEHHLASCPACLAELDELIDVVPALASLSPDDLTRPEPSPDLFARIAHAVQPAPAPSVSAEPGESAVVTPISRVERAGRSRRWLLAAAASIVVLAGGGIAIGLATTSTPSSTTASASAGSIRLAVAATDVSTGTRLALSVHGLPAHLHCRLVATADDGTTHPAGTWDANYDGAAQVVETTAVSRSDLSKLTLYGNGRELVSVPL